MRIFIAVIFFRNIINLIAEQVINNKTIFNVQFPYIISDSFFTLYYFLDHYFVLDKSIGGYFIQYSIWLSLSSCRICGFYHQLKLSHTSDIHVLKCLWDEVHSVQRWLELLCRCLRHNPAISQVNQTEGG